MLLVSVVLNRVVQGVTGEEIRRVKIRVRRARQQTEPVLTFGAVAGFQVEIES